MDEFVPGGHFSEVLGARLGQTRLISGLWQLLDWTFYILFVLVAFNLLYIYGPAVEHRRWRWLMPL